MMVWLPRMGEKPFTLSYPNAVTVKKAGAFTEKLAALKPGDEIGLRGPLGQGYPPLKKPALIGGGVGIAELRLLALASEAPSFVLGGRTADEILFYEEFRELGPRPRRHRRRRFGTQGSGDGTAARRGGQLRRLRA